MEELTKREKAYAMACLVNNGYDKPRVSNMKMATIHSQVNGGE